MAHISPRIRRWLQVDHGLQQKQINIWAGRHLLMDHRRLQQALARIFMMSISWKEKEDRDKAKDKEDGDKARAKAMQRMENGGQTAGRSTTRFIAQHCCKHFEGTIAAYLNTLIYLVENKYVALNQYGDPKHKVECGHRGHQRSQDIAETSR